MSTESSVQKWISITVPGTRSFRYLCSNIVKNLPGSIASRAAARIGSVGMHTRRPGHSSYTIGHRSLPTKNGFFGNSWNPTMLGLNGINLKFRPKPDFTQSDFGLLIESINYLMFSTECEKGMNGLPWRGCWESSGLALPCPPWTLASPSSPQPGSTRSAAGRWPTSSVDL